MPFIVTRYNFFFQEKMNNNFKGYNQSFVAPQRRLHTTLNKSVNANTE
jgi:hypothetical protein